MTKRLKNLWNFIEENLELNYGYLPESPMDDEDDTRIDEYIQEIKDDIVGMIDNGWIIEEGRQECMDILKGLDYI